MSQPWIIETRGISKRYAKTLALDNLTLQVPQGGVHALVGSNGAGKSTLFRILLGLLHPTSGESWVLGHPSQSLSAEVRGRIGLVHEEHTLPGWLKVSALVSMQRAQYLQWTQSRFDDVIGHFNIKPTQLIRHLSRGERAGLNLALALAQKPDLLILDEPTLGLDVVAKQAFLESLMFVGEGGGSTVLYCSHQMDEVERLAESIIIMSQGRLVTMDSPEGVTERVHYWATDLDADVLIEKYIPGLLQRRVIDGTQHLITWDDEADTGPALRRLGAQRVHHRPMGLSGAINAILSRDHHRPEHGGLQ